MVRIVTLVATALAAALSGFNAALFVLDGRRGMAFGALLTMTCFVSLFVLKLGEDSGRR